APAGGGRGGVEAGAGQAQRLRHLLGEHLGERPPGGGLDRGAEQRHPLVRVAHEAPRARQRAALARRVGQVGEQRLVAVEDRRLAVVAAVGGAARLVGGAVVERV